LQSSLPSAVDQQCSDNLIACEAEGEELKMQNGGLKMIADTQERESKIKIDKLEKTLAYIAKEEEQCRLYLMGAVGVVVLLLTYNLFTFLARKCREGGDEELDLLLTEKPKNKRRNKSKKER